MINPALFNAMQNAIIGWCKANLPENRAHIGIINGGNVTVTDRKNKAPKNYPYTPTVDLHFEDGYQVACIVPDTGNIAAIVGVV